ncbi:MAG: hypothetical protein CTY37_05345 [Methylotenera sp.]|nr:MAG: hypothetical protein CTY37_05345 [Methylotenera sp.]
MIIVINYFVILGFVASVFLSSIGLLTLIYLIKPKKLPMDESNRINHIRLWWFVITRPELFVREFAWLQFDELDNINKDK